MASPVSRPGEGQSPWTGKAGHPCQPTHVWISSNEMARVCEPGRPFRRACERNGGVIALGS